MRHELTPFISHIKNSTTSQDIQAAVISHKLTNLPKDILLVNIYDSPENSSYKLKQIANGTYEETLESLNNILMSKGHDRLIMLCGDFNARTGCKNSTPGTDDQVLDDLMSGSFNTSSHPMSSTQRSSRDLKLNQRGTKLIDLATAHNLKIDF